VRSQMRTAAVRWSERLQPLFPTPTPPRLAKKWAVPAYLLALPALTGLILIRQSGVSALNSIWAEDGLVFYHDAVTRPFWSTLTDYNGYVELFPRLVIQVVRPFPIRDAAPIIAVLGAASLSALALLLFRASSGHLRSPAVRVLFVGTIVLLPLATGELLNNLVNFPWWLFFATFWLLLWRPATVGGSLLAAGICFLASASDPLVGLMIPVAIARIVALPKFREQLPTLGFFLGLLVQVIAVITASPGGQSHSSPGGSLWAIAKLFSFRVGLGWLTGAQLTDKITSSWVGPALGALLFVAVVALAFLLGDKSVRLLAVVAGFLSIVIFAVEVWTRGYAQEMTGAPVALGSRYSAVPQLLLLSVVLAVASQWKPGRAALKEVAGPCLCLLLLVPVWVIDLNGQNARSLGPQWSVQVSRAFAECRVSPAGSAMLSLAPKGWMVELPCAVLR
jgi:hypothetical protein